MKDETRKQITGSLLILFGFFIFLSIISYDVNDIPQNFGFGYSNNWVGIGGLHIANALVRNLIGFWSLVIPALMFFGGLTLCKNTKLAPFFRIAIYTTIISLLGAVLCGMIYSTSTNMRAVSWLSGNGGREIALLLFKVLSPVGAVLLVVLILAFFIIRISNSSISRVVASVHSFFAYLSTTFKNNLTNHQKANNRKKVAREAARKANKKRSAASSRKQTPAERDIIEEDPYELEIDPELDFPTDLEIEIPDLTPKSGSSRTPVVYPPKKSNYQFPTTELLDEVPEQDFEITYEELESQGRILEETLDDFGIVGKVVKINPGPIITRFEVEPAPGIKVSRFTSLADDLARVMRAKRIRIEAPIPGKASIGIEIPNLHPQTVYFADVATAPEFHQAKSPLSIILGKTIEGRIYTSDLKSMPHLLIAGSTGSGKSVCINAIITSMLFKANPQEVQFVLIDPKRLELAPYRALRKHHLLFRSDLNEEVITTPANAILGLKSVVQEMENRYDILAEAGVRSLDDFNEKIKAGKVQLPEEMEITGPLPYIVVVVDELADLMLTAARQVEEPIARLAQMSRAVGIHLIVATQRPSVDVITGVIKANFPCRIGFYVASKTDSRTILDMNGAEKLLGRGDMLFLPPGAPEPVRLHGSYISTGEVERVVEYVSIQPMYQKKELPKTAEELSAGANGLGGGDRDALFNEAAKMVVYNGQGSASILQRRLKIGYNRAGRLIEQLEDAGIVGPHVGSKAREVLVDDDDLHEMGIL